MAASAEKFKTHRSAPRREAAAAELLNARAVKREGKKKVHRLTARCMCIALFMPLFIHLFMACMFAPFFPFFCYSL